MLTKTIPRGHAALPARPLATLATLGRWLQAALQRTTDRGLGELRVMSDRELTDLGIGRSEIPAVETSPGPARGGDG